MKFSYKARSDDGRMQKGIIESSTRQSALDVLDKYNLKAVSLNEQKNTIFNFDISFGSGVKKKDLVIFARQFSVMLKSAISPLEGLRAQVAQTSNQRFREQLLKISESVETGISLSEASGAYPKTFNKFFVNIIKAGETTGKLADSLSYLAEHLEREYTFNQKVRAAMFYPMFIVGVFIAAGLVVAFFIVPKLTEILKAFDPKGLPWPTKLLMFLGDFIQKGGWLVLLVLIGAFVAGVIFAVRSKKFKRFFDVFSLKLPLLGDFFKKIQLSRFAENFSVLLAAGISIVKAIEITSDIITNSVYRNILKKASTAVSQGEQLSSVLKKYPEQFPPFAVQMVSTGEKSGEVSKVLMDLVRFYRGEIERTTDKLTTLLEPIMLLILGIAIAILAFAVFVPLFNLGLGGIG